MSNKEVAVGLKITGDATGGIKAADDMGVRLEDLIPTAKRAEQAASSLDRQFSKLGIRSANQINAEILEINQALLQLAQRVDLTADEFDRAFAAAQKSLAALKAEAAGVGEALNDVGKRAANTSALLGKLGMVFSGLELARQFILVNAELENIERSFQAVTGSVERAAAEMDYARDVANRLGLAQISTAKAYADLMAGTKGSAVEGEKTRAVFESVARAMNLAGRSSAETEGALKALEQMASKGVVQMEELRGQLGDRLPGALNAVASGLGVTTDQLIKLVDAGQMTTEELFPALSDALNELYKDANTETLSQEWQHFKTAVENAFETIGDAGVVDVLKNALEGMEAVVFGVSTGLVVMGKNLGVLMAALKNGDIGVKGFSENAKQAFAEIEAEVRERTNRIAQHNSLVAAGLDEIGKKMLESSKRQTDSTNIAVGDWTRINVAYNTVKESGAQATKQAEKLVEATKASGEASIAAAAALGGEADGRRAKAEATLAESEALAALAERRREELAMAEGHIAALQQEADAAGGATAQQQKVLDGLIKVAEARRIESAEATAQADRSQYAAAAAKVEAAAYEALRGTLSQWSQSRQAQMSLDQAGIRLLIEQQRTILEVARARGDEYGATEALLKIKQLEIKLAELVAQAKMAEAKATLASVSAEREALKAKGELSVAKEAELKASEAGARVKQIEAQIAAETAKRLRELADAHTEAGSSAQAVSGSIAGIGEAARSSASGVDSLTDSVNRLNAAKAATAAKASGLASPNDTFGSSENSKSVLDDPNVRGRQGQVDMTQYLYKRGGSIEEVKRASKYIGEFYARNQMSMQTGNLGTSENAASLAKQAMNDAADKALAAARQEMQTGQAVDLGTSVSDIVAQKMAKIDHSGDFSGWAGSQRQTAAMKAAGNEAKNQPIKTIKIDLGAGSTDRVSLFAEDEDAANRFLDLMERKAKVSSRR